MDKVNVTIGSYEAMTAQRAADYLGISMSKLNRMIAKTKAGILKPKLKWIRLHETAPYIFRKQDLDEFIEECVNA